MQTILLVEDAPANLVARSLILRCFGYTVLEASSRGEAWSACHETQGPVHLILMKADLDDDGALEFMPPLWPFQMARTKSAGGFPCGR